MTFVTNYKNQACQTIKKCLAKGLTSQFQSALIKIVEKIGQNMKND